MTSNRISATLKPEDRKAIMTAIGTIKQAMPFLVQLSKEERKRIPKTGDRGRGFVLNCLEAAQQHTDCLPRSFNIEEMQKDIRLVEDLYPVLMALSELQSLVDDTYLAAHSEAYVASLRVYDSIKLHKDQPGVKVVADQLKQQFARRSKKATIEIQPNSQALTA